MVSDWKFDFESTCRPSRNTKRVFIQYKDGSHLHFHLSIREQYLPVTIILNFKILMHLPPLNSTVTSTTHSSATKNTQVKLVMGTTLAWGSLWLKARIDALVPQEFIYKPWSSSRAHLANINVDYWQNRPLLLYTTDDCKHISLTAQ